MNEEKNLQKLLAEKVKAEFKKTGGNSRLLVSEMKARKSSSMC